MALANVEAQDTVQFTQPEASETFHQLTEDEQTIFGADFCEQTCGFDDTEIEIEEADDLLYSFVERLKTFAKQMVDSMAKAVERSRSNYDPESAADGVLCKLSEIGNLRRLSEILNDEYYALLFSKYVFVEP
ncbi:hypothetical protein OY671_003840 [Metschnikowia pulcherrima]|nr:hypothetical protein OY671_003840 [Metschnikowia pulcherrima]